MKYVSNTTKNPISYKDKVIPPGASVMLNNKGEIVDEVTDNTEEIEKLKGAVSKAVTLAQVDTRLEEVECRIVNLVTSANSKQDFDINVDLGEAASKVDWSTNCITSGYYISYSGCWCVPIDLSKTLKPGVYVNDPLTSVKPRKIIQFEIPVTITRSSSSSSYTEVCHSWVGVLTCVGVVGKEAPRQIGCSIYELSNTDTNFVLDISFYKRGSWVMDNPRDIGRSSWCIPFSSVPADTTAGIRCWNKGKDFGSEMRSCFKEVKCTLDNGDVLTNETLGKVITEKLKSLNFAADNNTKVVRIQ